MKSADSSEVLLLVVLHKGNKSYMKYTCKMAQQKTLFFSEQADIIKDLETSIRHT